MSANDPRAWVRAYLGQLLGLAPDQVVLDQELGQFGLDSVDAVIMAGEMEKVLGVEIDPAAFLHHPTIEAMVAALEHDMRSRAGQGPATPTTVGISK